MNVVKSAERSSMKPLKMLLDRTAVLFIGIATGAAIGYTFLENKSAAGPANVAVMQSNDTAGTPATRCPTGLELSPALQRSLVEGTLIDIGVFGDSFGDGIWAGLYNEFRDLDNLIVHRFTKQSTGFTRYDSLNLIEDVEGKLGEQAIDLAVISFGANDTWDIWEEGQLMPYMSDEWQRVIGSRVREYVGRIKDSGAVVVWVGLPSMRKAKFNEQVTQMNAFHKELMCELDVPFIDTLPKSVDENGGYTEMLERAEGGPPIMARAGDGIHMTMTGYRILVEDMTRDIRNTIPAKTDIQADVSVSAVAR
jgi:uncharacterized protein